MHTVVLGWFGVSAVWFIPLFWRLAKTMLPGGAGLAGRGSIRLWLGFVCVLVASCTLAAVLPALSFGSAGNALGHALSAGFAHVLGPVGTPVAMLVLLGIGIPWLFGFGWRDASTWLDASFGIRLARETGNDAPRSVADLPRGALGRDDERRVRRAADVPPATAHPVNAMAPKREGRYARPTSWKPDPHARGQAAAQRPRVEPVAPAGWIPPAAAGRTGAVGGAAKASSGAIGSDTGKTAAASLSAGAAGALASPVMPAAVSPSVLGSTAARAAAHAADRSLAPSRRAPMPAATRPVHPAMGSSAAAPATTQRAAPASIASGARPAFTSPRQPVPPAPRPKPAAPARAPLYAWVEQPAQPIVPAPSVQETLRAIEASTAQWTVLAGGESGTAAASAIHDTDRTTADAQPDAHEQARPTADTSSPASAPDAQLAGDAIADATTADEAPDSSTLGGPIHTEWKTDSAQRTEAGSAMLHTEETSGAVQPEDSAGTLVAPWEGDAHEHAAAATLGAGDDAASASISMPMPVLAPDSTPVATTIESAIASVGMAPPSDAPLQALSPVTAIDEPFTFQIVDPESFADSESQPQTPFVLPAPGQPPMTQPILGPIHPSMESAPMESSMAPASIAPSPPTIEPPPPAPPATLTPIEPASMQQPPARPPAPNAFEFHAPAASLVELPGLDLLEPASDSIETISEAELAQTGQVIEQRLQEFKVPVAVVGASAGPVITRFEIEPALGVRGSQIVGLMKDLSRGLGLTSIRVVETIPGKTCMGLELPNAKRQMIRLSEILASRQYQHSASQLTLAMGKDIIGHPVVTDLAKAPHMLVAGTTGSGKSVAINAMILSLLYKATPEDVRLIMIDPKMLELSVYEGIPHLLAPVVTDMKLAANALNWCVGEMERRYRLMSALGVRNLASFNQKIRDAQAHEKKIGNPFSLTPDAPEPLSPLPLIVVVIDELADLMMVAGKKIEELIARLAQKARAAGIHLILATQRPSVDVITGLIKANIPTRVAFQVSSKIDSRTILDQMGAESLLGQGDMLFLPPGTGYPQRVHGAFVADEEVHRIVEYLKQFGEPQYEEGILDGPASEGAAQDLFGDAPDAEADPLYDEAVAFVVRTRRASISSVQRQLRIGYNRAARLVEQMETAGLVSPMGINGSREVLAPPLSE